MDKSNYKRVANNDDGLGLGENILMNIYCYVLEHL